MNYENIKNRIYLYCLFLIVCEIIQFLYLNEDGYILGDFYSPMGNPEILEWSLFLSIGSWIVSYYMVLKLSKISKPKVLIKPNNFIIGIFLINFLVIIYTNQGVVGAGVNTSLLSLILAIIPINYLITINFFSGGNKLKLLFLSLIYIAIDLYRSFLGAILHIAYLCLVTFKNIKYLILIGILILISSQALIEYKIEKRGGLESIIDSSFVVKTVTSRLSMISTYQYALENDIKLADFCVGDDYANILTASVVSIIPKKLLGISSSKTFNNCLIEYHLSRSVDDSSVNSPWFLNIYLYFLVSPLQAIFYMFFSLFLMLSTISIANYLFGYNSLIFSSITLPSFISTGNVLFLILPLYLMILIIFYNKIIKYHKYHV